MMKTTFKSLIIFLLACTVPVSVIAGQQKKSEQKVKVVVSDGKDTRVIVDTVMTVSTMKDTILTRDGNIFVIRTPEEDFSIDQAKGEKQYTVTVTSDDKKDGKQMKTITVVSGDSAIITKGFHSDGVTVISKSNEGEGKENVYYKVIKSNPHEKTGKGTVYYYKEGDSGKMGDERFDVFVEDNDVASMDDAAVRYVIAKHGVVVTVEGKDEEKAKEIFDTVRKKLDEGDKAAAKK
jgi:hypothetical protein